MPFDQILTVNLICSTVIHYVGAKIHILPKIDEWKSKATRQRSRILILVIAGRKPERESEGS